MLTIINLCQYSTYVVVGILVLCILSGFLGASIKEVIDNARELNNFDDEIKDEDPHKFI